MKYRVVVTAQAELEAADSALWWAEHRSSDQAARWYRGLEAALQGLASDPERHPKARENAEFAYVVRRVLFGIGSQPSHRIVYHVEGNTVTVIAIRHVAQRDITPDDL